MTKTYLMDQVKTSIAKGLLQVCDKSNTLEKIVSFLEYPKNISHGDLCLPVRKLSYPAETNPVQLAKEISEKFPVNGIVEKTTSIGIYINFSLNRTSLISSTIEQVLSMQQSYGTNTDGAGKTVVLDYSSPNIAKPFHAGHLRSTIIGNFLCNALKANGYHTVGINYLGDWGKQYGLLAVGYAKYGDEQMLKKDPIKHLFDVYVKINKDAEEDAAIHDKARELFARMEAGDEDVLSLWRRFRDLSIEKYKVLYERLGISFDVYSGESFYEKAMKPFVEEMKKDNLLVESNGALISDLNEWKLGNTIVLKKDGTSTYITRDIAAANGRFDEYKFEKMLYVVASAQELHLCQLFKVCELMKRPWAKSLVHVSFGMVEGMSTRRGNVVFLEDVIDDAKQVMHDVMKKNESKYAQIEDPEKTADTLAISAIMIQDMRAKRIKNYQFDMDRMTSFEGDTGPYLQYAHSRLFSIQRKYESASDNKSVTSDVNYELLTEPIAYELAIHLAKYPDVLKDIVENYEPCTLVNYLMVLSHLISQSFDVLWVMGQEDSIAKARLALIISCRMVLGSGLKILGIKPLERM